MTPTTELPDEITVFDGDYDSHTWFDGYWDLSKHKNQQCAHYTRKDKADAEIARLRAAVRDLAKELKSGGQFGMAINLHADTIRECME